MSAFICPACGESTALFGEGGGEETSARLSTLVVQMFRFLEKFRLLLNCEQVEIRVRRLFMRFLIASPHKRLQRLPIS
jgi:Mrp family chromosome partitioning ATPase